MTAIHLTISNSKMIGLVISIITIIISITFVWHVILIHMMFQSSFGNSSNGLGTNTYIVNNNCSSSIIDNNDSDQALICESAYYPFGVSGTWCEN